MTERATAVERARELAELLDSIAGATIHPDDSEYIPSASSHVRASQFIDYAQQTSALVAERLRALLSDVAPVGLGPDHVGEARDNAVHLRHCGEAADEIVRLRARLAEQEGAPSQDVEPVVWRVDSKLIVPGTWQPLGYYRYEADARRVVRQRRTTSSPHRIVPLYASPPDAQQLDLDTWVRNCREYEAEHQEEGNKAGAEYHRGAADAFERVRAALTSYTSEER